MLFAYDAFLGTVVTAAPGTPYGWDGWSPMGEIEKIDFKHMIGRDPNTNKVRNLKKEQVDEALAVFLRDRTFDSGQMWLAAQEWDGVPRINKFLTTYVGAPDTPYAEAISYYIWTALAGRIIEPGVKADMMPVYISPEGWGKSTGLLNMCPNADRYLYLNFDQKDAEITRLTRGRCVVENADLDGFTKRDVNWMKAYLSNRFDVIRPLYKEFMVTYARRFLVIGTSNILSLPMGDSGGRRFLPIELESKERGLWGAYVGIPRDRNQLWAEAAELFAIQGVMYNDAERLGSTERDPYREVDTWPDVIDKWMHTVPPSMDGKAPLPVPAARDYLRLDEIMHGALGIEPKHSTAGSEKRAASAMRKLGWNSTSGRIDGKVQRVWRLV